MGWKIKLKQALSCAIFLMILLKVFLSATYLMRDYGNGRERLVGLKSESVDIVYIGGSAAFVYWQPLKAWNDYGMVSYLYATNTLQAESIEYLIREARLSQDPELFVIDARPFQYWTYEEDEAGLRNFADAMRAFSPNRWRMIQAYLKNRNLQENTDKFSYYLDIAKYHTNLSMAAIPKAWQLVDNKTVARNKGWEWVDNYAPVETPIGFETDSRTELPKTAKNILDSLLAYCQSEDLQVLFVVCPYYITAEDQMKYNEIQAIVEERGFSFLNTNLYLAEIGLDYAADFYNVNHVNCFGAEKYTAFLEDYLKTHYDLPDRRGEHTYSSWNQEYERFADEEQQHKAVIEKLRAETAESEPVQ